MNKNIRSFIIGGFVASSLGALAVNIPNSFSAGQPIKAADVNANFSSLKSAVDALAGSQLAFGGSLSGTSDNAALEINNTGGGVALQAETSSSQLDVPGVLGINLSTSGQVVGVIGQALNSPIGTGVSGFGRITGGYFEAKSASSGGFTPTGVYGVALTSDGTGVKAWNKTGGMALEVNGGIRVTGANRPAFRLLAVGGPGPDTTVIDDVYSNNDVSAIVTVTGIGGSSYSSTLNYDGSLNKWVIQCKTVVAGGICPNSYNVIVVKTNG